MVFLSTRWVLHDSRALKVPKKWNFTSYLLYYWIKMFAICRSFVLYFANNFVEWHSVTYYFWPNRIHSMVILYTRFFLVIFRNVLNWASAKNTFIITFTALVQMDWDLNGLYDLFPNPEHFNRGEKCHFYVLLLIWHMIVVFMGKLDQWKLVLWLLVAFKISLD